MNKPLNSTPMRTQRGFSLIELMISILIASMLLIGTVALFQQSKSNSVQDEQIARMQEGGRYALRLVGRELAHVGYFGGVLDTSAATLSSGDFGGSCKTWESTPSFVPTYVDNGTANAIKIGRAHV